MPHLRIVLVEPQEAGNVGAAARVMKNFGFGDLVIVGEHPQLLPVAGWWASGADDLLAEAKFVGTLLEAIGDAHMTVATTSSRGRTTPPDYAPRTLAKEFASLNDDQTLALVFGREDSGLTGAELALCQYTAVIPTNARFPTMNLAQSIGVFCYELSQIVAAPVARELAPAVMIERMHERAKAALLEIGFLHDNNPDRIYDDLRALLARAHPDQREITILLGILHQLEWKLNQ
ncbi:MAG TPA: RNA methyltransferase [Thermoanaerobaculia bacterium]|nr:RNA methyltransferase [Thermoanaerobaculia bacterium]